MINKRLVAAVPGARRYVILDALLQWLALVAQMAMMTLISLCVARVVRGGVSGSGISDVSGVSGVQGPDVARGIAYSVGVSLLLAIVSAACIAAATRMGYRAAAMAKSVLRSALFRKLLALGPAYDQKVGSSEAVQMSVEGVDQMEAYFAGYLPQFIYAMAAPVTLFAYMCTFSPVAAIVLLAGVPLIPIIIALVQTIAKRIVSKYWNSYTSLGDSFLENLQGLTTLIVYGADKQRHEQMDKEAEGFRRVTMRMLTMQLNSIAVMDLVAYGGAAAGAIIATIQMRNGSIDLAHALLIVLLAADYFLPMRRLGSYFHVALNGSAAANKMFRILDLDDMPSGSASPDSADKRIAASHMSFAYAVPDDDAQGGVMAMASAAAGKRTAGKTRPAEGNATQTETGAQSHEMRVALTDVSFDVPDGAFLGIVGGSGSGKSTLAKLLCGRLDGYTGSLVVGGVEVRDADSAGLMHHVTLVESDSRMIPGTVRDNLMMARPDANDAQLQAALHDVRLDSASDERLALDTVIESNASNLSGGQRQRLALARALLHDTPVYIFDEATSNVDPESERVIMRAISRLARKHTVIVIAHRLINVRQCDSIIVLDHGAIAEAGSHADLLALDGAYAQLWRSQQELEAFATPSEEAAAEGIISEGSASVGASSGGIASEGLSPEEITSEEITDGNETERTQR
ncbi:ABC transporter ATP-binding protein/permease [Pseudoscardovia suis]|uniref:Cysteine ABC transporter ATP-binding protein n=1 Tax=Pseudoscardovia suis TaxID=987063 RepID=A0A261ESJ8_9BIFI|nr:ABC transporter ATP-binding protein/permease [Pseudoscardovia suis]OZG49636.1 cysteine ABC transporter ATP-binding protein [Pseudoscardovia suis]PJJ69755.1 ATP-binding cassette subfamily B protein [Pseudoscardovia suis]